MEAIAITTATEAFTSVEKLVQSLANKSFRIHGGEMEEVYAQACFIASKAINKFDITKGAKLSTFVYFEVTTELINYHQKRWRQDKLDYTRYQVQDTDRVDNATAEKWHDKVESLSLQAKEIYDLLIDMPEEIRQNALSTGGSNRSFLRAVREFLYGTDEASVREFKHTCEELLGLIR